MLLNICRKEYEHERASVNGQKKKKKRLKEKEFRCLNKRGKETERMCVGEKEREKEEKRRKVACMCANPVKMCQIERTWGRALGAESNG